MRSHLVAGPLAGLRRRAGPRLLAKSAAEALDESLSTGLPGQMNGSCMPRRIRPSVQRALPVNSGPLSTTVVFGLGAHRRATVEPGSDRRDVGEECRQLRASRNQRWQSWNWSNVWRGHPFNAPAPVITRPHPKRRPTTGAKRRRGVRSSSRVCHVDHDDIDISALHSLVYRNTCHWTGINVPIMNTIRCLPETNAAHIHDN